MITLMFQVICAGNVRAVGKGFINCNDKNKKIGGPTRDSGGVPLPAGGVHDSLTFQDGHPLRLQ